MVIVFFSGASREEFERLKSGHHRKQWRVLPKVNKSSLISKMSIAEGVLWGIQNLFACLLRR
jgi:hypothetical protein